MKIPKFSNYSENATEIIHPVINLNTNYSKPSSAQIIEETEYVRKV